MSGPEIAITGLFALWCFNLIQLWIAARKPKNRIGANTYEGPVPGAPHITVIVPARNEERNISACLDALEASDHTPIEVLVVDDRSEDSTRAILDARGSRLGDASLRVVAGEGPPPGWMGKVAACWRGRSEVTAESEFLLFLDADVRLAPEAIRQCLHYVVEKDVDGVTLIGFLENLSFWERTVQPVVGSLILAGNRPERINDPALPDAMANGQFILVRKEAYDAVGGHEAIAGEVLDDIAFARLMKREQRSLHLCFGRELFTCRMYTTLGEIWAGWSKNLFPGLHGSLALTLFIASLVFSTALLPFLLLGHQWFLGITTSPFALLCAATVLAVYGTYGYGLHVMGQRTRSFWTYPLGVVVLLGILANSALRISLGLGVTWKGRRMKQTGTGGAKPGS